MHWLHEILNMLPALVMGFGFVGAVVVFVRRIGAKRGRYGSDDDYGPVVGDYCGPMGDDDADIR